MAVYENCPECGERNGVIEMPYNVQGFCDAHQLIWEIRRKDDGRPIPDDQKPHEWKVHGPRKYHRVGEHAPQEATEKPVPAPRRTLAPSELVIDGERGIAYQADRRRTIPYGMEYFNEYAKRRGTDISKRLNAARVAITERYCTSVMDIGIGAGEFIDSCRLPTVGYDVNRVGVDWLRERQKFVDPYANGIPANVDGVTLWDVLEHMPEPNDFLRLVSGGVYLFVSLPIFDDLSKLRESKHFKPGEHLTYFTERGLLHFMGENGFRCIEANDAETRAGRDGIKTFVFRRVPSGVAVPASHGALPPLDRERPLVVRTMNGIGDLCWSMAMIANAKAVLGIQNIVVDMHLAGDFRDNRAVEFIRRLDFVDYVMSSPFPIKQRAPVVRNRIQYMPSGYNQDRTVYTLIPNGALEWGQRLETLLPTIPVEWRLLTTRYFPDEIGAARAKELSRAGRLLGDECRSYVCLHLGAESDNTRAGMNIGGVWTPRHWVELASMIRAQSDLPIYVLGAEYDRQFAERVFPPPVSEKLGIVNLCGQTSCTGLVEILRRCELLVSFASGVAVCAVYLGVPTVCFWNPEGRSMGDSTPYWFSDAFATSWVAPAARYRAAVYGRDDCDSVFRKIASLFR